MVEQDASAFHDIFCVVFLALDDEWVRTKATYLPTHPTLLFSSTLECSRMF